MAIQVTLGKKIGGGYALVSLILAITVAMMIYEMNKASKVTDHIIALRTPTVQASTEMLNGINDSLAALRGWIILGKENFRSQRAFAWSQEIEASFTTMEKLSRNWTNPENVRRLEILKAKLADFKKYQQEIEDIAHSPDNQPALKILFEQAAPQANIMATKITAMIDMEMFLEANAQRKALLGMMADVRGTTGLALANIRAYLLSGDEKFKDGFDTLWRKNTRRFKDLSDNAGLLISDQAAAFEALKNARTAFDGLPAQMFALRSGENWNLANTWLGTKAAPTGAAIKQILMSMVDNQKKLMADDVSRAEAMRRAMTYKGWGILGVGIIACAALGILLTRGLVTSISRAVSLAEQMAVGDLSHAVHSDATDEIGRLIRAMEKMRQGLTRIFMDIAGESTKLVTFSGKFNSISGQLEDSADNVKEVSATVSVAAEEMSTNMTSVATAVEQAGINIKMVAESADQMAHTIQEISQNSERARGTTSSAVDKARNTSERMAYLGEAASAIGKVTQAINDISEQTNLLALNATIEAARAGDAGKGFAVVAGEIKDLARQTADATNEIREKIDGIQNSTSVTLKDIDQILDIIQEVNDIVSAIASAVEEQSINTREIADNVNQASEGIQEITMNVSQSSSVSADVARDIVVVDQSSGTIQNKSQDLGASAGELSALAGRLNSAVARFKLADTA